MADASGEMIIDWAEFRRSRSELGTAFVRILGYFREDGTKSVERIEVAMRALDAAALIVPAHTLKGEAAQFGATALADLGERIETTARQCVEWRTTPDELLIEIVKLRPLFDATLAAFDGAIDPLVERRGFGRRAAGFGARVG